LTLLPIVYTFAIMLKLNHRSSTPLHAQVEQLLRDLIRQPRYQNGELLPNEESLAAELGISRGTVRSGVSKLVFEGALERKAGVGTRVVHRPMESGIRAWRSFTREMAAKGISVKNFSTGFTCVPASADALRALQLDSPAKIWRLERVRGWNGKPVLQSVSWFHPRLGLKGDEDFNRPLYELIEGKTGVRPHHSREEFLAATADAHLAGLLKIVRGAPLLLRRHTVFDPGNRPFEFAEVHYVSSRFTLTMDLRQE
jgi:GntR family transcriptional regulator